MPSRSEPARQARRDLDRHDFKLEWSRRATEFIDFELRRRGITYRDLAERLTVLGVHETEASISRQINEGTLPTWLLLAAMESIGLYLDVSPHRK
jgi:hypothetical protein